MSRAEFDEDSDQGAWVARREMDRELISAITRLTNVERDMERVKIAVFGFHGDNGLLGTIEKLNKNVTELNRDLKADLSTTRGQLHTKIDEKMTWVYRALIGAALSFAGAAAVVVLFGPS